MKQLLVVGEDDLSCALGERLVMDMLPGWSLSAPPINTRGITKLVAAIPRYMQQARYVQPVLCVADTDQKCPVELISQWLPASDEHAFFLRLAVPEAESWVLADREQAARFFGVSIAQIVAQPESLPDPKREVLRLARKSSVRRVRQEVVSQSDINKQGSGYNVHLCGFVRSTWRATRAAEASPSLARAVQKLTAFSKSQP